MPTYPDYVYQTLVRARTEGQWYCGQSDAAALCFDVLALFPECEEAKDLVYELFCDEWTIYDNRVAIQRNMDEWDDRPWQQRRRLALSYRFMCRWEGKYATSIVDWSFLDADDGQSGEPADWVKKRIHMYEKWKDELHTEMLENLKRMHKWTRNIPPPSTPKRNDPNGPSFNPSEILGGTEWEDHLDEDT